MVEKQNRPFQLSFNPSLRVDFQVSRVTPDGGLLLLRELDESLGLSSRSAQHLTNDRRGENTQTLRLLHQSIYSRLTKYEDVNGEEKVELLKPSVGQPSHKPIVRHEGVLIRLQLNTARRVVARAEIRAGELFAE
jgi:hypothetical protein